jgi:hypothetical protein
MILRCPYCYPISHKSVPRKRFIKFGFYRRRSDKSWIQRYRCFDCKKGFSSASLDPCYKQKKRQFNSSVFEQLSSGTSQRRCAYLLKLNRKTIRRKFIFLGIQSLVKLQKWNLKQPKATSIEFDDLETFEHTKLKPLSVTLAVESKTRRILSFSVSSMPAKGLLTKKAVKKYGPRTDDRPRGRKLLLSMVKGLTTSSPLITSDSNPHYPSDVQKYFPECKHIQVMGKRGVITAQGELKKVKFDPIFSLNHTCAKLRADVNRLIRKTWCTTKSVQRLRYHLAIYSLYHNRSLLSPKKV